jgi:large subunit ribosomal protein L7/L12
MGLVATGDFEHIFEIFDRMTVLELSKFTIEYEKRYGVSRNQQIQVIEKPSETVVVEEVKSLFDLYLINAGVQKIQLIKEIKEVTGKGLLDSKLLADNPPAIIQSDLSKNDAETLARRFKDLGAEVEIR